MYSVQLNGLSVAFSVSVAIPMVLLKNGMSSAVMLVPLVPLVLTGKRTHFCLRLPMKSCRPMRAKTLRQNTVRIMTSDSFFTDWISAPTMVFKPERERGQGGGRGTSQNDYCLLITATSLCREEAANKSLQ